MCLRKKEEKKCFFFSMKKQRAYKWRVCFSCVKILEKKIHRNDVLMNFHEFRMTELTILPLYRTGGKTWEKFVGIWWEDKFVRPTFFLILDISYVKKSRLNFIQSCNQNHKKNLKSIWEKPEKKLVQNCFCLFLVLKIFTLRLGSGVM